MIIYRLSRFAYSALLGLAVGFLLLLVILAQIASSPAAIVVAADAYTRQVKRGGTVSIEFEVSKSHECITQTTRWLWRDVGQRREIVELAYAAMSFGHDDPDEPRRYRFFFEVPVSIPPGEWNVRTLHADYCWPWSWVLGPRLRSSPTLGLVVE